LENLFAHFPKFSPFWKVCQHIFRNFHLFGNFFLKLIFFGKFVSIFFQIFNFLKWLTSFSFLNLNSFSSQLTQILLFFNKRLSTFCVIFNFLKKLSAYLVIFNNLKNSSLHSSEHFFEISNFLKMCQYIFRIFFKYMTVHFFQILRSPISLSVDFAQFILFEKFVSTFSKIFNYLKKLSKLCRNFLFFLINLSVYYSLFFIWKIRQHNFHKF